MPEVRKPMWRYDPLRNCPKCGEAGERVQTIYCRGGRVLALAEVELHDPEPHLDRLCSRCGYRWLEFCLDDPDGWNIASEESGLSVVPVTGAAG